MKGCRGGEVEMEETRGWEMSVSKVWKLALYGGIGGRGFGCGRGVVGCRNFSRSITSRRFARERSCGDPGEGEENAPP
jgi:hypothetical protein